MLNPTDRDLRTQKNTLETRLDDGWDRIDRAEANGQDTEAWTDFWVQLLNEYQGVVDALTKHDG
jgi:hypothetical protein